VTGEQTDRAQALAEAMRVELAADGERYVTLGGVALGRLTRGCDGRWRLEWRAGWHELKSRLPAAEPEHAEGWAVEETATLLATEEVRRRKNAC
jgi:hypothetical protein